MAGYNRGYNQIIKNQAKKNQGSQSPSLSSIDQFKITSSDPTKKGSASDLAGQLLRAEWEDYETRFRPYDQKLVDIATGKSVNEFGGSISSSNRNDSLRTLGRNSFQIEPLSNGGNPDQLAKQSFDISNGINQRNMQRLGISQNPDELANSARLNDAALVASQVATRNNMRMATEDRKNRILSGNSSVGLRDGRSGS